MLFYLVPVVGRGCLASALLVDPKALLFGTRLRTKALKNSPPDCFFTTLALLGFKSHTI